MLEAEPATPSSVSAPNTVPMKLHSESINIRFLNARPIDKGKMAGYNQDVWQTSPTQCHLVDNGVNHELLRYGPISLRLLAD